eukprot:2038984-Rhodomonas_salina.1
MRGTDVARGTSRSSRFQWQRWGPRGLAPGEPMQGYAMAGTNIADGWTRLSLGGFSPTKRATPPTLNTAPPSPLPPPRFPPPRRVSVSCPLPPAPPPGFARSLPTLAFTSRARTRSTHINALTGQVIPQCKALSNSARYASHSLRAPTRL